jgi:predicted ATP-grasp superfamily ATP-dependent carboligase
MTLPKRILILDGQTNQALACVRSLGRAGYTVLVASHRRWPLSGWSHYCRVCFLLAGQTVEAFASLRAWAYREGVHIVLPLTEKGCLLCNAERQEWEALGIIMGCGPTDMLLCAFDKAQTLQRSEACGITTPPTRFPESLEECRAAAREVGFPCVVKPRFSHAWNGSTFLPDLGTTYVTNNDALDQAVVTRKQGDCWPLIQGFVEGQGKGVFALCDHGRAVVWFAHERLRDVRPSGSGSSLRRSIRLEPRLKEPAERLLSELQWHGPAMVEFRDDGVHPPYLIEVNGRLWGSLQLAVDAGTEFPRLWVAILTGKGVESATDYVAGVTSRWLWGDVKRFLYILKGPPAGYPGLYPTIWQGVRELLGPQPDGTRLEVWQSSDPWPAVGEWMEGIRELMASL